jgi:hypothetical protein
MENEVRKVLEIRTDSGEMLFRLRLIVKDDPDQEKQKEESKTDKGNGGNGKVGNYEPMTDAQKRYLFRLLAEQGIEKDAAHDELKKTFGVDQLKKVTKQEASQEIERRLAAQKGGNGNGRA